MESFALYKHHHSGKSFSSQFEGTQQEWCPNQEMREELDLQDKTEDYMTITESVLYNPVKDFPFRFYILFCLLQHLNM